MDEHSRNWSFFDPSLRGHLGLQLMSSIAAEKPLFGGGGGGVAREHKQHRHHHHQQQPQHQLMHHGHPALMAASTNGGLFHHHRVGGLTESSIGMEFMRDSWINHREKYLNNLPNNNHHHVNYGVFAESSSARSIQMLLTSNLIKKESGPSDPQLQMLSTSSLIKKESVTSDPQFQEPYEERDVGVGVVKRMGAPKIQADQSPRAKKVKRAPRVPKDERAPSIPRARVLKKSAEVEINGISMDISGIPIPVCTCTGAPQQCYRWGSGGWQSACCTTCLSMYPLPMSTKRRGARIAGRKMSVGAFKKVLEKLASEDFNFSNPIDLKSYWAKHGTNKFVTIR